MNSRSDDKITRSDDLCDITMVDESRVRNVMGKLGDEDSPERLAELFKAFADPTRVKILMALTISELCVCDIAAVTEVSQSAISHQLRFLRMARLVKYRKDGKMAYYSLDDDHVRSLLAQGLLHVQEDRK